MPRAMIRLAIDICSSAMPSEPLIPIEMIITKGIAAAITSAVRNPASSSPTITTIAMA